VLYWGCRRKADLYRTTGAERRGRDAQPALRAGAQRALPDDAWTGRTGFVHQAVMADWPDLSGHQVYACGAPVMVDSAQRDFVARCGLPADEFFADSFTSELDKH
jgi:CDP-4-dehydro-6-deoxyglucose reductase, E3